MLDLAILILNWNVRDLLARCLRSVQDSLAGSGLSYRVLVVDNASTDGSAGMLRTDFPEVELLLLPENRGFAGGNNAGLAALGLLAAQSVDTSPALLSYQHVGAIPNDPQDRGCPPGQVHRSKDRDLPLPRIIERIPVLVPGQGDKGTKGQGGEGPRYVLLLNPDAEVDQAAIPKLVAYLDAHPEVGVVGPQLRYPDGSLQSSRRRFPTVGTLFWESTPLEWSWPHNPWVRRYRLLDRPDDVEQEVDWLVGACLLLRAETVAQAGPLDEGYFLYFEELEWCRRIREAGWRVVYLPQAQLIHHEGRSTEQVPLNKQLYFQRSKLRYARQVFGRGWARALRAFLLAMYAWQWLVEGAKWLLGHKRALRRERMGQYWAILRTGLRVGEVRNWGLGN